MFTADPARIHIQDPSDQYRYVGGVHISIPNVAIANGVSLRLAARWLPLIREDQIHNFFCVECLKASLPEMDKRLSIYTEAVDLLSALTFELSPSEEVEND